MTRREALKVKVGDMLVFLDTTFQVTNVTEDNRFGKPSVIFWGMSNKGLQVGYPHRMCRRLGDDRTENAVKSN